MLVRANKQNIPFMCDTNILVWYKTLKRAAIAMNKLKHLSQSKILYFPSVLKNLAINRR